MQQQFARTHWFMRTDAMTKSVDGDMYAFKPHFTAHDMGIGLSDLHLALAQTFDFTAMQDDSGFDYIDNRVVVSRFAVARNYLRGVFFHGINFKAQVSYRCLSVPVAF